MNKITLPLVALTGTALLACSANASLLTPDAAFASSENNEFRGPENTIDNPTFTLASEHPWGENDTAWQTASNEIDGAWIAYDLGDFYNLTDGHVWNYDQAAQFGDRGIRNMDVYVSSTDTADVNSAVFTLAVDNQLLADPNAEPVPVQTFGLSASNVRWVRFTVDGGAGVGNFGGNRVGLFETKFTSTLVPEPGSLALLGLGGLLVASRRRRG